MMDRFNIYFYDIHDNTRENPLLVLKSFIPEVGKRIALYPEGGKRTMCTIVEVTPFFAEYNYGYEVIVVKE